MSDMHRGMDKFVRAVEEEARAWREYEAETRAIEAEMNKDPTAASWAVFRNVSRQLLALRERLDVLLGVDLVAAQALGVDIQVRVLEVDSREYFRLLTDLAAFRALWEVFEYATREDATPEGLCAAFVAARKSYPARHAFAVTATRTAAIENGKAGLVPETMLAESLSALVFARAKLSSSRRGAVELREKLSGAGVSGPESPARRFIHEAAGEVLPLASELGTLDPELRKLTNETTRRIRRFGAGKNAPADQRITGLDEASDMPGAEESERLAADELERLIGLAGLSRQEREAFEASVLYGNEEASRRLGRPANQVRQEKYRALRKLRKAAGL